MSTPETTAPAPQSVTGFIKDNLREYGMLMSLVVIVIFFQFATGGILLKPLNLTNIILQNSYIVIMALGMLMIIVTGHIDLSVGSVAGFIGAVAAMMMVQYLIDQDATVDIPGVEAPVTAFADLVAPVQLAVEQERRVTDQINGLTKIARDDADFASDQFMQWFIKEQVEVVATMTDLLAVVKRARDVESIEDYVAREQAGTGSDPTAPPMAGAGA